MRSALEGLYPHIAHQVVSHWGSRTLNDLFERLLLDSATTGGRGLHPEAFSELLLLQRLHASLVVPRRPRTLSSLYAPAL